MVIKKLKKMKEKEKKVTFNETVSVTGLAVANGNYDGSAINVNGFFSPHGEGKCTSEDKGETFTGTWKDGKLTHGTHKVKGVSLYKGGFKNGKYDDESGIISYAKDQLVYKGGFVEGNFSGNGNLVDIKNNSKVYEGIWSTDTKGNATCAIKDNPNYNQVSVTIGYSLVTKGIGEVTRTVRTAFIASGKGQTEGLQSKVSDPMRKSDDPNNTAIKSILAPDDVIAGIPPTTINSATVKTLMSSVRTK